MIWERRLKYPRARKPPRSSTTSTISPSAGCPSTRLIAPAALSAALELAGELSRFPQNCLRSDRLSACEQWGLSLEEALATDRRERVIFPLFGMKLAKTGSFLWRDSFVVERVLPGSAADEEPATIVRPLEDTVVRRQPRERFRRPAVDRVDRPLACRVLRDDPRTVG